MFKTILHRQKITFYGTLHIFICLTIIIALLKINMFWKRNSISLSSSLAHCTALILCGMQKHLNAVMSKVLCKRIKSQILFVEISKKYSYLSKQQ